MSVNSSDGAAAAAEAVATGEAAASGGGGAATPAPYAAMAEALLRGLGSFEAAAAVVGNPLPGGDDDVLGIGLDDGEEIDDAILEDEDDGGDGGEGGNGVEIHAVGEIDEPMDAQASSSVPAASAPGVAAAPAVRPKEVVSGRAQWHAQAAPRADRGASEGERREYWRSASWIQRRLAVNRLACVSFHGLPFFSTYPNLAAARILNAAGGDNVLLLRDMEDPTAMLGDFGSQLSWVSPLFWSSSAAVKDAVTLMSVYRGAIAWNWFDEAALDPPVWPTMMGVSPWTPNQIIGEFRGRLKLWRDGMKPGMRDPTYQELDDLLGKVFTTVRSVYDQWAPGQKAPSSPLWFPAGLWGAVPKAVASSAPGPVGGSLREQSVADVAPAPVTSGLVSAPVVVGPPEVTPGPEGEEASQLEAEAEALREQRKERRRESRANKSALRKAAWEVEQKEKMEEANRLRREALAVRGEEDRRRAEEDERRRAEDKVWRKVVDERTRVERKVAVAVVGESSRGGKEKGKGKAGAVKAAEEELRVAGEAKKRVEEAYRAAEENLRFSRGAGAGGGGGLLSYSLPVAASQSSRGRGFGKRGGRGGSGAGRGAGASPAPSSSFRGGRGVPRGSRGSWVPRRGSFSLPPPAHSSLPPTHTSTPVPQLSHRGRRGSSFHANLTPIAPHPPAQAVSPGVPPPDVRGIVEGLVRALAPALAAGGLLAPVAASPASGLPSGGADGGAGRSDTS